MTKELSRAKGEKEKFLEIFTTSANQFLMTRRSI
uniref:Uncharacterized protein n=1 Tax=Rhizophora mucronata TaxID=61149 RepID=A0A2P2PRT4_RHIMU